MPAGYYLLSSSISDDHEGKVEELSEKESLRPVVVIKWLAELPHDDEDLGSILAISKLFL